MNTIQVMLKAIRQAITVMENDTPNSDVLDLCYKSLSEGEAELAREPDATVCRDFSRITPQTHSFQIDMLLPVGAKLYTREEIK